MNAPHPRSLSTVHTELNSAANRILTQLKAFDEMQEPERPTVDAEEVLTTFDNLQSREQEQESLLDDLHRWAQQRQEEYRTRDSVRLKEVQDFQALCSAAVAKEISHMDKQMKSFDGRLKQAQQSITAYHVQFEDFWERMSSAGHLDTGRPSTVQLQLERLPRAPDLESSLAEKEKDINIREQRDRLLEIVTVLRDFLSEQDRHISDLTALQLETADELKRVQAQHAEFHVLMAEKDSELAEHRQRLREWTRRLAARTIDSCDRLQIQTVPPPIPKADKEVQHVREPARRAPLMLAFGLPSISVLPASAPVADDDDDKRPQANTRPIGYVLPQPVATPSGPTGPQGSFLSSPPLQQQAAAGHLQSVPVEQPSAPHYVQLQQPPPPGGERIAPQYVEPQQQAASGQPQFVQDQQHAAPGQYVEMQPPASEQYVQARQVIDAVEQHSVPVPHPLDQRPFAPQFVPAQPQSDSQCVQVHEQFPPEQQPFIPQCAQVFDPNQQQFVASSSGEHLPEDEEEDARRPLTARPTRPPRVAPAPAHVDSPQNVVELSPSFVLPPPVDSGVQRRLLHIGLQVNLPVAEFRPQPPKPGTGVSRGFRRLATNPEAAPEDLMLEARHRQPPPLAAETNESVTQYKLTAVRRNRYDKTWIPYAATPDQSGGPVMTATTLQKPEVAVLKKKRRGSSTEKCELRMKVPLMSVRSIANRPPDHGVIVNEVIHLGLPHLY
jgi:hypothetical protein